MSVCKYFIPFELQIETNQSQPGKNPFQVGFFHFYPYQNAVFLNFGKTLFKSFLFIRIKIYLREFKIFLSIILG